MTQIHGGQIIARALKNEGVDVLFALTGGHILPILDGCVQEGIRVVDFRHEQAAAHAAEAYSRLTGRLGVVAVTAGPGVTDSMTAVATAKFSGTPMLVLGGRHMLRQELMGGLQEMNHPPMLAPITTWAGTAWQTDRLAESVATAIRHAFTGRGGPAFLDVPMDLQFDMVNEEGVSFPHNQRANVASGVDAATLDRVVGLLASAERPVVFAGFSSNGSTNRLVEVTEALQAPTYANGRARGSLPFDHDLAGNHTRSVAFAEADLVLALGVDWDFRTGYGQKINAAATVVQIDLDGSKVGWNRPVDLGVVADPSVVVTQLADAFHRFARDRSEWTDTIIERESTRRSELQTLADVEDVPIMPNRFARDVAAFFGPDSIVAVDGGDIVSTTARWLQVSHPGHVLDPGPFGSLGTGPPYAIAAKIAFPDRRVGIVFGDGGFGFNGMEYDTMVRHGLAVIGVMGNDGVWSNIKTIHKMFYPDRLVATDLGRRPYHAVVSALGGHGSLVTTPAGIEPALNAAEASGLPSLVNVHIAETMRASSNYSQ
jgi:acetolactate synthase-1/2/3 large subunit